MAKNEHKKKKKPQKEYISCAINSKSSRVDRESGKRAQNDQELDRKILGSPCDERTKFKVVFYAPRVKTPRELAQEFYWCDEHSFYAMQVPFNEARDFALASFTFKDADPEVFNFLPRVRRAQKAAMRYVQWLALSK
jgi:hypothetical protein